jgi:peroxiredoxin
MSTKSRRIITGVVLLTLIGGGALAQDLSFTSLDGQAVTTSSMRGNVSVLLFSGVQDPQCRDGIKALESLAERFRGKPVQVYWVSINSPAEATSDQIRSACGRSASVSMLRDGTQAAFKRFSGKRAQLPTVAVLDQQGNPAGQPRGGFNPNTDFINDLASLIDSLLAKK